MIKSNDYVGISFWVISVALLASTVFLLAERNSVRRKWRLPVTVSAMVTGIAAVHYFYMRELWVTHGENPIVHRYIDWILTVPLQLIEFYLILYVAKKVPVSLFNKLLLASIVMIGSGFLGETNILNRNLCFIVGTIAWLYILYELFYGEAAKYKEETDDKSVIFAFNALKWIVTLGWAIYPIGYLLKTKNMNLVYNIGDFINKILFAGIIWYSGRFL